MAAQQAPGIIPLPQGVAALGPLGGPGGGPNTGAIAGLPAAPAAPVGVPGANALGPPGNVAPTLLALNLPAANQPAAVPGGGDPYVAAWEKLNLLASTGENNNLIAAKADEFRTLIIGRLRQIYFRVLSMQNLAGGGRATAQALVEILDQINQHGYTVAEANALNQLATDLQNMRVSSEMAGLIHEINALAGVLGITQAQLAAGGGQGPIAQGDDTLAPLEGGRRKKKAKKTRRKKHKGGYKFTRAAISRRSLRQSRRKSLRHKKHHKKHNKKHNKKHKRTKKRRRRKRR